MVRYRMVIVQGTNLPYLPPSQKRYSFQFLGRQSLPLCLVSLVIVRQTINDSPKLSPCWLDLSVDNGASYLIAILGLRLKSAIVSNHLVWSEEDVDEEGDEQVRQDSQDR